MDDLFKKYKTVLLENENISIQLQKEKTKVMLLQEELNMLKCQDMPNTMKESISKNNAVIKTMDDNLENENLMLKQKVSEYENLVNENEKKFRDFYVKSKKYVMGLLGYEMNFTSDNIELLSLYAFQSDDKLIFQLNEGGVELLSNEFAETYKNEIDMFLNKGKSIPAFLAHVTLDLVNKKTFN